MILFYAWLSMLCVGAAHHTDPRVPALGYVTTLMLAIALHFVAYSGATGANMAKVNK